MKSLTFPSVLVSAAIAALVVFLQYISGNLPALGVPEVYIPLAALAISTLVRMVQEYKPTQGAYAELKTDSVGRPMLTPRSVVSQPEESYWKRVIAG